jgi:hypothetical protein
MPLRPCTAYPQLRSSLFHYVLASVLWIIGLNTDHRWYMQDLRAHVCGLKCLCVCARARMSSKGLSLYKKLQMGPVYMYIYFRGPILDR